MNFQAELSRRSAYRVSEACILGVVHASVNPASTFVSIRQMSKALASEHIRHLAPTPLVRN